jgi:class 3 adenylate cyclase
VERRGDDIVGLAVHLANRVASWGGPGEVLVSRTVVDLTVGSDFSFESRGEQMLKGFDRPWELFALARR